MSFSSLNIGSSALFAAQRAVEVAAHNVANANTDGYTRQRLTVTASQPTFGTPGSRGDGDRGTGVTVVSVQRLRDRLADVSYRSEAGVSGAASARAETLGRAESVLGVYGDGAPEALSSFLASWDQLALTPADPAARASVLNAGQLLADSLSGADAKLTAVSGEVALRVGDDVNETNGLLASVAKLNTDIQQAQTSAREPNDLLDQRDTALDRLSALTGARIDTNPDGTVTLTAGGVDLVRGDKAAVLTSGGSPTTISVSGGGTVPLAGEIGGYVSVAAVDLPSYRAQLDDIARLLHHTVNTSHAGGLGTDGSTGQPFFSGTTAASITVDPALTTASLAASASGSTADGNNALAVATALRGGSPSVGDTLRGLGSRIGQATANANRNAATQKASVISAQAVRASADGVSVDEEMVDLVKYQHSYEAAAKVISIADGMLDKIINGMVR